MGLINSIIVKGFLRAEPFESEPLDKLAQDMKLNQILKRPKTERYYKAKANRAGCSAFYDGSIVFDKKYYDMLSPDEVLAVGAHEFTHLAKNHVAKKLSLLFLPPLAIGLLVGLLAAANPSLAANFHFLDYGEFTVLVTVFPLLFGLLVSSYAIAPWLRQQETDCDLYAAKLGYDQAMINALEKVNVRFPKSKLDVKLSKYLPRNYPPLKQRTEDIRKTINRSDF